MGRRSILILAAALAAGCSSGGDDGSPSGNNGSISITLSATSVSIVQGANGTVTITLNRTGGFAGAVGLTVQNAPSGVTATVSPASLAAGATSATITLQVGAAVAAGTTSLTVRASGTGVSDATATLSLVVTAAPTGSFALTLSPASLTVQQGGNGQVTVNIARTAPFAGAVALTATGLPTGVTPTFNPASAPGASATLTLNAAANAATGTTTVTVRGAGTGVTDQTATFSLVVNATSTGGTGTWPICPGDPVPVWFGVQDGTGAWMRVQPVNNVFTFNVPSVRGAIAQVLPATGGGFDIQVFFSAGDELRLTGTNRCANGLGTKTVNGTVAGVGAAESVNIALGGAFASILPGGGSAFTLQRVADGNVDLIASRVEQMFSGTTFTSIVRKLIIRRGLNPAHNSTLPVLDFNAAEAFDPVTSTLTVNNLNGDQVSIGAWYQTSNGFVNSYFAGGFGAGAAQTYYGIPAARQQAGDLHALQVSAFSGGGGAVTTFRSALLYFRDATDRTVTLGPQPSVPTISTVATAPYVRFRAQVPVQTEYDRAWAFGFNQGPNTDGRTVVLSVTRGYAGSVTTLDIAVPDFTAASGWNSLWGPRAGVQTQWSSTASDFSPEGGPVVDGGMVVGVARTGTITP